jgi:hypothetical protein
LYLLNAVDHLKNNSAGSTFDEGFELSYNESQNNTVLKGAVKDQSRLQATLEKVFNLNPTLLELRLLLAPV